MQNARPVRGCRAFGEHGRQLSALAGLRLVHTRGTYARKHPEAWALLSLYGICCSHAKCPEPLFPS